MAGEGEQMKKERGRGKKVEREKKKENSLTFLRSTVYWTYLGLVRFLQPKARYWSPTPRRGQVRVGVNKRKI